MRKNSCLLQSRQKNIPIPQTAPRPIEGLAKPPRPSKFLIIKGGGVWVTTEIVRAHIHGGGIPTGNTGQTVIGMAIRLSGQKSRNLWLLLLWALLPTKSLQSKGISKDNPYQRWTLFSATKETEHMLVGSQVIEDIATGEWGNGLIEKLFPLSTAM